MFMKYIIDTDPGVDDAIAIMMAPVALCGFITMDGAYLETIALRYLYLKVLTPAKRKVKCENYSKNVLQK